MRSKSRTIWLSVIIASSAVGLYFGWRQFWFMTDDALIAFRYVSNSILGLGYVWNPPPFRPVEGYTSFLWVMLLDLIWRWFSLEPPQVANWLALGCSFLSLLVTTRIVLRMSLGEKLSRFRLLLLTLVLFGILTNRTFLAWTSSGLETALFNCCFLIWVSVAIQSRRRGSLWLFSLTAASAVLHLTRPDGLLILLSTVTLVGHRLWNMKWKGESVWRRVISLSPLIIPVVHLGWRRLTYGEWLPNTYYAKFIEPWPEAGLRYLASFLLEYGLWLWLGTLVWVGISALRRQSLGELPLPAAFRAGVRRLIKGEGETDQKRVAVLIVTGTIAAHIGYYTLIIGGDHFEYRVFSYLIPLIFISMLWLVNRLTRDAILAAAALALLVIVSWPVQWTHWLLTRNLNSRDETWIMRMPIASEFPSGVRWYAESFDSLQSWLIEHHICMRHQEHKVFYEFLSSRFPKRSLQIPAQAGEFPIAAFQSVGVPGWVFPRAAILDGWGLNDYVIARHKARPSRIRYMAHDRFPPQGYIASFSINYGMMVNQSSGFIHREFEITAEEIKATEQFWIDRIVRGVDRPFPYAMLNRIGESLVRLGEPDSALIFFREAFTLDSSQARVYIGLGRCFNMKGATDSAIFYLTKACTLEPDNPLAVTRLGCAYAAEGYAALETDSARSRIAFATAESHLHRALGLDSSQVEALVELASIALFSGQLDSSAIYLSLLENRAAGAPDELHLLGDRYIFKQQRDLAVRAYRLAIRNGLNTLIAEGLIGKFVELAKPARSKQLTE